jgi:hypothetical protein
MKPFLESCHQLAARVLFRAHPGLLRTSAHTHCFILSSLTQSSLSARGIRERSTTTTVHPQCLSKNVVPSLSTQPAPCLCVDGHRANCDTVARLVAGLLAVVFRRHCTIHPTALRRSKLSLRDCSQRARPRLKPRSRQQQAREKHVCSTPYRNCFVGG